MNFDLAAMARRARNPRRATIDIRPNTPTAALASDLYRAVYLPIIKGWQEWLTRIEAAYARALPSPITRDSADEVQATLNAAEAWLDRLIVTITPAIRQWALRSEKWQRGKWIGAVLTATGIDLSTLLSADDATDTVDAFLTRNVALVRSVNDETRARIADVVLRGYQNRVPPRDVAKEMRASMEMSRARAIRIAADQNAKLAGRLDQARQEQAGIRQFKWRSSHKRHPRAWHAARDGKVYDWSTRREVGGGEVIKPGDMPRQQPFCGCTSQAVLSFG